MDDIRNSLCVGCIENDGIGNCCFYFIDFVFKKIRFIFNY